jgi:hypothetical protein
LEPVSGSCAHTMLLKATPEMGATCAVRQKQGCWRPGMLEATPEIGYHPHTMHHLPLLVWPEKQWRISLLLLHKNCAVR